MKTVPTLRVVSKPDAPAELAGLGVSDLPAEVRLALTDIAGAAREGLPAMSMAAGMVVMQAMFTAEIAAACGPKGQHDPDRAAVRPGAGRGSVVLGGRRVPVSRPQTRTVEGGEVPLACYRLFAAEDQLTAVVMERMLAGLATRRHVAAGEPVSQAVAEQVTATSRSAVSRRFIAATRTALAELLNRDLAPLDIKVESIAVVGSPAVKAAIRTDSGSRIWSNSASRVRIIDRPQCHLRHRRLLTLLRPATEATVPQRHTRLACVVRVPVPRRGLPRAWRPAVPRHADFPETRALLPDGSPIGWKREYPFGNQGLLYVGHVRTGGIRNPPYVL
jgi:hypothetical protein